MYRLGQSKIDKINYLNKILSKNTQRYDNFYDTNHWCKNIVKSRPHNGNGKRDSIDQGADEKIVKRPWRTTYCHNL